MFIWLYEETYGSCARFVFFILLFFSLISSVNARTKPDKGYLRIQQAQSSEKNDLKITSLGALAFTDNRGGHIDLTYLESEKHGDVVALDFGGGYAFNWDVSLFLGLGITLGYNQDKDDTIGAYYPEASIVLDVTESFGISATVKRYHYLYGENDAVVMVGVVFR